MEFSGAGEPQAKGGIRELPQFPQFVSNVHTLHQKVNVVSKQENIDRLARLKITPESPNYSQEQRYSTTKSWNDFVLHDLRSFVTPYTMITSVVGGIGEKTQEAAALAELGKKVTLNNRNMDLSLSEKIMDTDKCLQYFSNHIDSVAASAHGALDSYLPFINNAKTHFRVWDMVSRSAQLLKGVKNENYDQINKWFPTLEKTQVAVGDLFAAAAKNTKVIHNSLTPSEKAVDGVKGIMYDPPDLLERRIDGVKGIMLFNLIKNADAFRKSYIKVSFVGGEFIVENDLEANMDDSNLFKPMEPKKIGKRNGNTGFGLFTVKNIYGTLSGNDVTCVSTQANGEQPATVRFSLRKSPSTGSESLPLPLAQ